MLRADEGRASPGLLLAYDRLFDAESRKAGMKRAELREPFPAGDGGGIRTGSDQGQGRNRVIQKNSHIFYEPVQW
jgi:hypothetical protein